MSTSKRNGRSARSTQQLLGIQKIQDGCISTRWGDLAFFVIQPTNLNVLPQESVTERVHALLHVLKSMEEVELLALNASESFDSNQQFYRSRLQNEPLPALRRLLEEDAAHLDRFRASMASARQFCMAVRLHAPQDSGRQAYLSRLEKNIRDSGFRLHLANDQEVRRMLALYFEQDISTAFFEEIDGRHWLAERSREDEDTVQSRQPDEAAEG